MHLEADPYEEHNLINSPDARARLTSMQAELQRLLHDTEATSTVTVRR